LKEFETDDKNYEENSNPDGKALAPTKCSPL